ESQALVEECRCLLQAIGLNSAGGQLDRQGHTVELTADARDDCRIRVVELQSSTTRHCTFHEQLDGGKHLRRRRRQGGLVEGAGQRRQFVDVLAFYPESLATRCQDVDLRCGLEQANSQGRRRLYEMLASIED